MGSPKESLKQKNVFTEKYDEIRRLDGTVLDAVIQLSAQGTTYFQTELGNYSSTGRLFTDQNYKDGEFVISFSKVYHWD